MGLSVFYGTKGTDDERLSFLDTVHASGATFWDSADVYGDNEDLLGQWFARSGKRDDIFLATKFSQRVVDSKMQVNNEPDYIRASIDASLQRLGTDHVDLWYCHRLNGKVPVETVVKTMKEAVDAGKVRHPGLSEVSAETLRRACTLHPIAAVQIEYSPFTIDIEKIGLLKGARELGVSVVAYAPLGRGMLTGLSRAMMTCLRVISGGTCRDTVRLIFQKNLQLVHQLDEIAKKKDITSSQLTLAWLLAQGEDIIPIPGTKKEKYLKENMGALEVRLTADEEKEIRNAVEKAEIAGSRYPAAAMAALFADTPKP